MSARSAQRTTASRGDRDGQEEKRDAQDDAACRAVALAIGVVGSGALAQNLRISTGLPDNHYWVAQHMNTLINTIKEATGGAVTFTTFYFS